MRSAGHLYSMPCTCSCCCGACCDGNTCTQALESGCTGVFQGKGGGCEPNPCYGICCTITGTANTEGVEGFCEEIDQATCLANGGEWYPGKECENAICSCDCADPGYTATCGAGGSVSFIIGKACVLPAHIQVTFTSDDSPPVVTTANYYHASGTTFTVSCTEGDTVSICVNPDAYFECDPDEGCKETSGGSLTFQECYEGVGEFEACAERIRCVENVGCVQAYDMNAGGYPTMGDCEADCAWGLWVGDGPKAQFVSSPKKERTPRAKKPKGDRPAIARSSHPPVPHGAGAELKKLLATIGITSKPGCSCNKRAREMDQKGPDWCAQNIPTIVGWLEEEHTRQKIRLPFSKLLASLLVRYAIRRARAITKGDKNV